MSGRPTGITPIGANSSGIPRQARSASTSSHSIVVDEQGTVDGGDVLPGFQFRLAELFALAEAAGFFGGRTGHDLALRLAARIADEHFHDEAVELGFRQRIGALVVDGILGGQSHERRRKLEGFAIDGHLPLLHHL